MGQTRANIAPADQHNTLIRLFQSLQFAHDRANMLRGGNKEYFIAGFHNRRTLRANRTIVAENSGHTRIDMRHMLPHGGQRIPYQRTTVIGFYYGEADFPFGEVHDLKRARIFDQAVNIVDDQLFRGD